ncbi:MAG: glycosyltransferase family 2 protein [Anaerolineae bacterium]|nr:glycosyltransferase family 2 protein [Anaerolineae bacterium]
MLDLSIIIVNYRTPDLLRDCLTSIYASVEEFSFEVYVVDNCSEDESCGMVELEFPQVRLIASPTNGGYPYANNLGLRALGFANPDEKSAPLDQLPRYVLLLNADTRLPPTALADVIAYMDAHPDTGIVGPRLVRADGSLDKACRRAFPSPAVSFYHMIGLSKIFPNSERFARYNMTYLDPSLSTEVDAVNGAFMMLRRESIVQVGLLDETFFMYGEDLDWAFRIKQAGWKVFYKADVKVLHYKGAASRHSRKARYEFYRAMYLFYRKHYAQSMPFWVDGLVVLGIFLAGGLRIAVDAVRGPKHKVVRVTSIGAVEDLP